MIDPMTLIALFGPAIKDTVGAVVKKFTGDAGSKPANVGEFIQLQEAETKQLEARAKIGDTEGETYKWVVAAVKLQRPTIVYLTILTFLIMSAFSVGSEQAQGNVANMGAIIIFWLFGERFQLKAK